MLWTLLIWVVVGLVSMHVWPVMVLVRANRNGYDLEVYDTIVNAVLDEDAAETNAKYNKFVRFILIVIGNVLWPYKLIWITKKFIPEFDERYEDLVLEKLEKGELA